MFSKERIDYAYSVVRFLFIIVVVVALGVFAVNQTLSFRYKSVLLQQPCGLCRTLNPEVESCFVTKLDLFPDGKGGWKYANGSYYNGYVSPDLQFRGSIKTLNNLSLIKN